MLPQKGVPSAVVGTVRRWCRDYAAGLEESSRGEVPRLQKFRRHNCWVFAAPRKWKRQLTAESAECCRTRDGSRRPSREAPAWTATGEPRMPLWTGRALEWVANGVRVTGAVRGTRAAGPPRNWVHKKIPGCAVELHTQNCAWFGSQISLITAMSFREAMPPRTTHQGLYPWTQLGDFRSPDPLCPTPTSKSWLRHWFA